MSLLNVRARTLALWLCVSRGSNKATCSANTTVCVMRARPPRVHIIMPRLNTRAAHLFNSRQQFSLISLGIILGKSPASARVVPFCSHGGEARSILKSFHSSCSQCRRLDKNNFLSACLGCFGFISPSRLITLCVCLLVRKSVRRR